MTTRKVLAVHDISCVGRCSLTVALPIISAAGIECSVLPTAVLSTHTGGFQGFTYRDLTSDILPIQEHWKSLGLGFGAVYTGFLGSYDQIDLVKGLIDELTDEGSNIYVDPVMGDEGKLYSIFDSEFPKGMRTLCEKADVLMPNLTELCMMLGLEYVPGPYTWEYIDDILGKAEAFGCDKIIITGVSFEAGKVGVVFKDYGTGEVGQVMREKIEGYFHGTGDVFGSALVAALESSLSLRDAVRSAVDFTVGAIKRTHDAGVDVRYGVDFEEGLRRFSAGINALKEGIVFQPVETDMQIFRVSGLASSIWTEAYAGMIPDGQTDYMVTRMQSPEAIRAQIGEGYSYYIIRAAGEDAGYFAICPKGDRMFLSKVYVAKAYRGLGLLRRSLGFIEGICREKGIGCIYLTVNRGNDRAMRAYTANGFRIVEDVDTPIGGGFEMNDHILELRF
jgi:pyridoxine kinase